MRRPMGVSMTAALLLLTAAGTLVFWGTFFADLEAQREGELAARSDAWYAWELSFPAADGWLALTAILGAVGLWRMQSSGPFFGLVSAGAMVFLGLMDILFFVENDLYLPLTGETAIELFIHVWLLALGLWTMGLLWKHRAAFPRGD
jgi:hypothetical protein